MGIMRFLQTREASQETVFAKLHITSLSCSIFLSISPHGDRAQTPSRALPSRLCLALQIVSCHSSPAHATGSRWPSALPGARPQAFALQFPSKGSAPSVALHLTRPLTSFRSLLRCPLLRERTLSGTPPQDSPFLTPPESSPLGLTLYYPLCPVLGAWGGWRRGA